jgi:[ribosomal protein S5]-alanine N-acetyltransferase
VTKREPVVLRLGLCTLREWRAGDAESLVEHANDRDVWRNLRDRFPHPYTAGDADNWLARAREADPVTDLAIDVEGAAVGGIGIVLQPDVFRRSAEVGYWLGRAYWRRGIATDALRAVSAWAFASFDVCRLHAGVFEWNTGSMRVLEKAGYTREACHRKAVTKDGQTIDEIVFALVH